MNEVIATDCRMPASDPHRPDKPHGVGFTDVTTGPATDCPRAGTRPTTRFAQALRHGDNPRDARTPGAACIRRGRMLQWGCREDGYREQDS